MEETVTWTCQCGSFDLAGQVNGKTRPRNGDPSLLKKGLDHQKEQSSLRAFFGFSFLLGSLLGSFSIQSIASIEGCSNGAKCSERRFRAPFSLVLSRT